MPRLLTLSLLAITICLAAAGQSNPPRDLYSDTWVATDALGRELPVDAECTPPRPDRTAGIFYFVWHGQHGVEGPYDNSKLLAANPANPEYGPEGAMHHWGEPELGYYLMPDEYVIRRHANLLTDAGISMIAFDVTNGFTYDEVFTKLCEVYREMRREGNQTPRIAFMTNASAPRAVTHLYETIYRPGLYDELWFQWRGKPLIMANPVDLSPEIKEFFTFRHSWAWTDPNGWFQDGKDKWPWLDHYPQKAGWHTPGVPEGMPVAVMQHASTNIGRSFHDGQQPPPDKVQPELGLCFAEQWKQALKVDPLFVFITGWNEWTAQRFLGKKGDMFLGQPLPEGGSFFVDCYNHEFSRDIEPMKGAHTDNYYYQMIANLRKYKGVRPIPRASAPKTISLSTGAADWVDVEPEFRDTINDTIHRDSMAWGTEGRYINTTGRNDFVVMKAARDNDTLYFLAETNAPITPPSSPNWMLLFLNTNQQHSDGWEGYDFVINRNPGEDGKTSVHRLKADGSVEVVGEARYAVKGVRLVLAVPRALVGLDGGSALRFDFHWADNIQKEGDITEFFLNGDSAPNRRFDYRFIAE